MISPGIIVFLQQLQNNNNKPWFEANRSEYTIAREDFVSSVQRMLDEIAAIDKEMAHLSAKECIFRINRDVRFSKDKRPYKNNMSAYFNREGKKGTGAGYYMHIEPGKSFAAAGLWMPEAPVLKKVRQEIDYNLADLKSILSGREFTKVFDGMEKNNVLSRPPKGYDENNPAIEYLKLKSFVISHPFSDEEISDKKFFRHFAKVIAAAEPFVNFLNTALE